jgi:hypothetical protein
MPSTGSWLDEIQDYTSLNDGDAKAAPVLYVTGKENVRKVRLDVSHCAQTSGAIWQGHGTLTKTYIAYYIFPKSSDKADEKLQDVTTALEWMSLQIAQNDMLYRKEMASLCGTEDCLDFSSLHYATWWQELGFDKTNSRATTFSSSMRAHQAKNRIGEDGGNILLGCHHFDLRREDDNAIITGLTQ